jgi:UDP-glucose 4-epimerase
MNVLVTGSNGYIGSVVTDELISKGHKVVALDNLSRGHKEALNKNARFIHADIGNEYYYENIFPSYQIDAVVHLAAVTSPELSMTNPSIYFKENVVSGIKLLDAMNKFNVKKIIFSSSATVYGQTGDRKVLETDELKPISAYGESKLMFEKILGWYKSAYGIDYVSFRYFNVAGATELRGQDHKPEFTLIPRILQAVLKGNPINIYGIDYPTKDGTCIRDYVHVSDIAQAHILALEKIEKVSGLAFNLSSVQGFSVLDVVRCAREVIGTVIKINNCPRRKGDPAILLADSTLARMKLGWQPKYTELKDLVKSAWDWQVKHPNGYKE